MDEDEEKDNDLTYRQIKMIDAPGFQQMWAHVEHFQLIRIKDAQSYHLRNQPVDIDNNPAI